MNVRIADRIRTAVTLAAAAIMVYAMVISAAHITHVGHLIGLIGYQAATLFIFIDLPALIGKALRLKYFAATTRRLGLKLMIVSGSLSLACNVLSGWFGGGAGAAGYGAFIVMMFLVLENVVTKIKPAASVTKAKNAANETTPAQPTARQLAARKAAATRARNAAMPVSPGVGPVSTYTGPKA